MTVVCVICGVAFEGTPTTASNGSHRVWRNPCLVIGRPGFLDWSRLPSKEQNRLAEDDRLVEVIPASDIKYTKDTAFFLHTTEVDGHSVRKTYRTRTTDQNMVIPAHPDCLGVSYQYSEWQKRFEMDFRAADGGHPTHLVHFYEIWCNRAAATRPRSLLETGIKDNYMYFLGSKTRDLFGITDDLVHTSPLEVPFLSRVVLNRLKQMSYPIAGPDLGLQELLNRINDLPAELGTRCYEALEPFNSPSTDCCRLFPSTWWKAKLLEGRIIPWLWDLRWEEKGGQFVPSDDEELRYRHPMMRREFGLAHLEQPSRRALGGNVFNQMPDSVRWPRTTGSTNNSSLSPIFGNLTAAYSHEAGPSEADAMQLVPVPVSLFAATLGILPGHNATVTANNNVNDENILNSILGGAMSGGMYGLRDSIRELAMLGEDLRPLGRRPTPPTHIPRQRFGAMPAKDNTDWLAKDWDWELLVRQLAQDDVLKPGKGILGDVPAPLRRALWNRKRIWDLLSVSRLGHIRWSI